MNVILLIWKEVIHTSNPKSQRCHRRLLRMAMPTAGATPK